MTTETTEITRSNKIKHNKSANIDLIELQDLDKIENIKQQIKQNNYLNNHEKLLNTAKKLLDLDNNLRMGN